MPATRAHSYGISGVVPSYDIEMSQRPITSERVMFNGNEAEEDDLSKVNLYLLKSLYFKTRLRR